MVVNVMVMGKTLTVAAPGNYVTSRRPVQIEQFRHSVDKRSIMGSETQRPVQLRRANNLSSLMIEHGQFSAVYFIYFFGKKCENQEDDFT